MTSVSRVDMLLPGAEVETDPGEYDYETVDGDDLIRQRILRFLFTRPGELPHRPDWGVGLQTFRGRPPTPESLRKLRNRIKAGMESLVWVEDHGVQTLESEGGRLAFRLAVSVDGEELRIPEVEL